MFQKQISVFLENKRGRLAEITKALGDNAINMRALCIADTADFGVLRIITDKPDLTEQVLRDEGYAVNITEVIAISVEDRPGGLAEALRILDDNNIDIEYMYHFLHTATAQVSMIMRVDKPEEALHKLKKSQLNIL